MIRSLVKIILMKLFCLKMLYGCFCLVVLCQCTSGSNQKSNENQLGNNPQKLESIQLENNLQEADRPSINIASNQLLTSPIKIKVNSEGKWGGFEGELGTIELFDSNKKTIGSCILSTTENWMVTGPVNYTCDLNYTSETGGNGSLFIKNNNPTGKVEYDKSFVIPVRYETN